MQGQRLGERYQIIECLQRGHLCETYLAQDTHLPNNPSCIVKKLQPQSTQTFVVDTAQRLFEREVAVLYNLGSHDRIPQLLAHICVGDDFYLVQECIDGDSLDKREIVAGQRYTEPKAIAFLQQVLEILAFVHQHNVIHRDIKPSNLMRRNSDGKLVLIDFGAVKEITKMVGADGHTTLTVSVGTPGYMPNEQYSGNPRFASDIYALGLTVIYALTGIPPAELPRDEQTGEFIWRDRALQASPALAAILDRMVRSHFPDRYQTVHEVLQDLQPLIVYGPTTPPPGQTRTGQTSSDIVSTRGILFKRVLLSVAVLVGLGAFFVVPRVWSAFQALQFYNQSKALMKAELYEEAIERLDRALDLKPDFVQALNDRGFALGKLGRHLERFSTCDRAVQIDPSFPEAWNCRGLAQLDLGKPDAAIADYNRALAIDGTYARAWYNKGEALLLMKRHNEAIAVSDILLGIEPDYFLAWYQKCRAFYQLRRFDDALGACDRALDSNQDYKPARELRQLVLEQQN